MRPGRGPGCRAAGDAVAAAFCWSADPFHISARPDVHAAALAPGRCGRPVSGRCARADAQPRCCAGASDPPPAPCAPEPIALPPADAKPGGLSSGGQAALDPAPQATCSAAEAARSVGLRSCVDCGCCSEAGGIGGAPCGQDPACSQGAGALISRPLTLQQAIAERLVADAYNQGSTDNLAVVVVDLGLTAHARPGEGAGPGPRPAAARGSGHAPWGALLRGLLGISSSAQHALRGPLEATAPQVEEGPDLGPGTRASAAGAVAALGPRALVGPHSSAPPGVMWSACLHSANQVCGHQACCSGDRLAAVRPSMPVCDIWCI